MDTPPRFLCDEMLGSLCRYLRAAGYDTLLAANGVSDATLLRQCQAQGRYFLTQDTLVREHKAANNVALILPQGTLDSLAAALSARLELNWQSNAFTRCLLDNTILVAADAAAIARVPVDARRHDEALLHCPACNRVYWQGSHYKRMRARLASWQAAQPMKRPTP